MLVAPTRFGFYRDGLEKSEAWEEYFRAKAQRRKGAK
jgi:hypothetical protein